MKRLCMEALGTFFLVLTVILTAGYSHAPFAIGLMLMALVAIGGHISGAHYNPAVTTAVLLYKKIGLMDALAYIASQLVGAFAAAAIVHIFMGLLWSTAPAFGMSSMGAIVIEALLTAILAGVILTVTATDKFVGTFIYPFAIGLTLTAIAFIGGPLSGGAFNPAVGIIPFLYKIIITGMADIRPLLIYSVGPLLGGGLAALLICFLNDKTR